MANIKSAKKRILQNLKKSEFNKQKRSEVRSKIKSLNYSVENKNKAEAKKMFVDLEPALSKSVNSGLFKKNTVSRTLSRLSKKIKLLN